MRQRRLYYDPFSGNIMVWSDNEENWVVQPTSEENVDAHWRLKEYMWAIKLIRNLAGEQIDKIFQETGELPYFNE